MPGPAFWLSAKARRRLQIVIYLVVVVAAVLVAAILVGAIAFRSTLSLSDRLAAVNDVLAAATLFLALAAGLITLQSFAATSGSPEIRVQVWFGSARTNDLVVVAEPAADGSVRSVDVAGQARLNIRLENVADFDATDLTVSIRCRGLFFARAMDERTNGWHVVDALDGRGALAAEWAAGSVLHRRATRRLPTFDLVSLVREHNALSPHLTVLVASSGFSHDFDVPVRFVDARPAARPDADVPDVPEWL